MRPPASTVSPAILLAAIAMQESSCSFDITGPNGEQGLMHDSTPDKCQKRVCLCRLQGAAYNINAGAKYLRNTLNDVGGTYPRPLALTTAGKRHDLLRLLPAHAPTATACPLKNNLDYLHQTFNGWMQGINPKGSRQGVFFNLKDCH